MPLPPISPVELSQALKSANPPRLIDVREPAEFISPLGHVAGAELIPLGTVPQNLDRLRGESREIICICKSGMRSQQAVDFLGRNGIQARNMTGGMIAWNGAQLPISREP